jgi:hypothetical protein
LAGLPDPRRLKKLAPERTKQAIFKPINVMFEKLDIEA